MNERVPRMVSSNWAAAEEDNHQLRTALSAVREENTALSNVIARHADAAMADIFGTSEEAKLIRDVRLEWEKDASA